MVVSLQDGKAHSTWCWYEPGQAMAYGAMTCCTVLLKMAWMLVTHVIAVQWCDALPFEVCVLCSWKK